MVLLATQARMESQVSEDVHSTREYFQKLLDRANIRINGDRPWDIQVHRPELYQRVMGGGTLALGESYMDGWWDCERLDQFFRRVLDAGLDREVKESWEALWYHLKARVLNLQSESRAYEVGERHYDKGNDLYRAMLDKRMVYSCAYWKDADTLDEAQENKLDLICRKIGLKPGMKVLDIGCGWGSFAKYAAEEYGVEVVGITVSENQVEHGRDYCEGLPVEIRLQDYRDLDETFDRIVSVGMFEHVGHKNYRTYMEVVNRCLKDQGLFLLHTIGGNVTTKSVDPWINKYIFPNGLIPSSKQITEAAEGLLVMEDWHNFGTDYDKTLMSWYDNFTSKWDQLEQNGDQYDERFYRMWTYYLMCSAGTFRARENHLWQIVFSPTGVDGGYESVR